MASPGSSLAALAEATGGTVLGDPEVVVTDATHDSRQAGPGALFVAVRGMSTDGHRFVAQAVAQGSPAVVVEVPQQVEVPQLVVDDSRARLATIAAEVHGHPSHQLSLVGVTGTNGKTTVTYLLESIAAAAGLPSGLIGTIQSRVGADPIPSLRTTPEATDLQRMLRVMVDRGARVVAAEVSSHALALGRVDATRFAVAAFTNLSQDHLDFHGSMEAYYRAKASLFEPWRAERAVIWMDDPWGRRLAGEVSVPVLTVGMAQPGDVSGEVLYSSLRSTRLRITAPGWETEVELPLGGVFNAANALIAAGCAHLLGIPAEAVAAGLAAAPPVPGRFELVSGDSPLAVLVDYAHTPAGIEAVVSEVRRVHRGRVIVVLGAGGDRDREKRPAMGRAASSADLVVVTSDNPRSEDPEAIIDQVISGLSTGAEVRRISDRRTAIRTALEAASPGDAVLVLGKGHERGQEVGGRMLPFDDRMVAREELGRLAGERTP